MKLIILKNGEDIYNHILDNNTLESKTLLLPTGSTPLGLYKEMISRNIDFSNCTTFNLDEYYKIAPTDVNSYFYYMDTNFFQHINIRPTNINLLDGNTDNTMEECKKYSDKIMKSGIDIAFLGIGVNGHIAFNEPGSSMNSVTRLVELNNSTQQVNKIEYTQALSVGITEILSSKKIILMALGETKADIIYEYLCNMKPHLDIPVSYLSTHPNFELYIDEIIFSKVIHTLSNQFMQFNKIMIFSPHPDDDVIGMGSTIKKMVECNKDVTVVYQTSGSNAGNMVTRQQEAILSLGILGLTDMNKIIFSNSPFYVNKVDINDDDVNYTLDMINRVEPDVIFFAGDVYDPHKTHLKCYNIIQKCLKIQKIESYNYYSAWDKPSNYDNIEIFNKEMMILKSNSIKAHASQLSPMFGGNLKGEFYEIIEKRNKMDGNIICKDYNNIYVEGFTKYNIL